MKHSLDRYLYVIGLLKQKQEYVCAADVGRFLGVKASAVSLALRKLRDQGYLIKKVNGDLSFGPLFREYADQINERIVFFRKLLVSFGVESSVADHDAVTLSRKLSNASCRALRSAYRLNDGKEKEDNIATAEHVDKPALP